MNIRAAQPEDISTMVRIIAHHASQGLMLPRSAGALAASLKGYIVADSDGEIVGCGSLHSYTNDTAELCALATAPDIAPDGTGRALVGALLERAREEHIHRVFALTLAPGFFTTTLESKTNFFAAGAGPIINGVSKPLHIGRSTNVWQTRITNADGRLVAIVTQTQMVLSPRAEGGNK